MAAATQQVVEVKATKRSEHNLRTGMSDFPEHGGE
jgi:hypothetical protein